MVTPGSTSGANKADADGDVGFVDSGSLNLGNRAPSAKIQIYRNRLVIGDRFPRQVYDFARSDVIRVELSWLGDGVRIIHSRCDCPSEIVFYPLNLEQVIAGFRRVGYPVEIK